MTSSPSILIIRSAFIANGPSTQALSLAEQYRQQGCEVVFAGAMGSFVPNIENRKFIFYSLISLSPKWYRPFSAIYSVVYIAHIMAKHNVNAVHSHNAASTILARLASLMACRPISIVTSVRGVEERPSFQWRNKVWRHLPGKIIPVCEKAESRLLGFGVKQSKIKVILNSVDLKKFDPDKYDKFRVRNELGVPKDSFVLINVGSFGTQNHLGESAKGQRVLVQAASHLFKQSLRPFLIFVGDGFYLQSVTKMACELNIERNCLFLGERYDIPHLLSSADLYCQPSIWGELLPNAIIEAMAMRLPWVGSDLAGLSELSAGGKAGLLARPGDREDLSRKIKKIMLEKSLYQEMSCAASDFVAQKCDIVRNSRDYLSQLNISLAN